MNEIKSKIIRDIPIELLPDFLQLPPTAMRQYANRSDTDFFIFYYNWINIRKCYKGVNPFDERKAKLKDGWRCTDDFVRFAHIDLSKTGDAAGIAVCHIPTFVHLVAEENEEKYGNEKRELFPFVRVDFLGRMIPSQQQKGYIDPAYIREIFYDMIEKRGFNFRLITLDGYQSWDTILRFREIGICSDTLSIDRTNKRIIAEPKSGDATFTRKVPIQNYTAPHEIVRRLLQDFRISLPTYTFLEEELQNQDEVDGVVQKVPGETDDVIQALAGSVFNAVNNIGKFVYDDLKKGDGNEVSDMVINARANYLNSLYDDAVGESSFVEKVRRGRVKKESESSDESSSGIVYDGDGDFDYDRYIENESLYGDDFGII